MLITCLARGCTTDTPSNHRRPRDSDCDSEAVNVSAAWQFGRAKTTTKPRRGGATNAGTCSRKKPAQKKAKKDPSAPKK